jgi:predicted MFS family arabinose efflux permease
MLGLYAVISAGESGWMSWPTLGRGGLALLLLTSFVARQASATTPLVPLRIFRSRQVSGANLVQILMVAALFSFQVLVTLYLQKVLGYGATAAGAAMLPAALGIGLVSLGVSARLSARFGERRTLVVGLVPLVGVLGFLSRVPVQASYVTDLLPAMLLAGGFGLALPALTSLAMSGASEDDAGLVSGLFNTTQQVGMAVGMAVLATIAASRTRALAATGVGDAEALTGGYRLAFATGAALLAVALLVALAVLRQPGAEQKEVHPLTVPPPAPA